MWQWRSEAEARICWRGWYQRAIRNRAEPLHTSLLEDINNKFKVIKRMACGFRDDAYYFLKIRAAFPRIP